MQNQRPLIEEVEAFLSESRMGESYFGKKAVGNSELVKRLRSGRSVLVETDQSVREFIANYVPSSETPLSEAS